MPALATTTIDVRTILVQAIDQLERTGRLKSFGATLLRTRQSHLDLLRQYKEFDQETIKGLLKDIGPQEKIVIALEEVAGVSIPLAGGMFDAMNLRRILASLMALHKAIEKEHALLEEIMTLRTVTRDNVKDINAIVQEKRVQYESLESVAGRILRGQGGSPADAPTVLSENILVLVAFLLHESFLFKELPQKKQNTASTGFYQAIPAW